MWRGLRGVLFHFMIAGSWWSTGVFVSHCAYLADEKRLILTAMVMTRHIESFGVVSEAFEAC
jgi:hypothetical protein